MRDELEEWRQEMAQPLQLDILLQTVRQHGARTKDGQAGSHTACLLLTRLRLALGSTGGQQPHARGGGRDARGAESRAT